MTPESTRIELDRERGERRDEEYLPRQRPELTAWPVVKRRTQEETEADFIRRSVACCYCGRREVPEDNECGGCGAKRVGKRLQVMEQDKLEREMRENE